MADPCRKYRYPDRDAAIRGAKDTCRRTGTKLGRLQMYRCDTCTVDGAKRAWHFGHRIGSGAMSKRKRW